MRGGGYVRSTKGVDLPTWVRLTILSNKMNFQIIEGFCRRPQQGLSQDPSACLLRRQFPENLIFVEAKYI